jgi:hypothetical protein
MLKVALGGVMIVAGLVLSFVPPFIFGPILFIAGMGIGGAGIFGTAKGAAKATVAGARAVQNHNKERELAERERALAARESATISKDTTGKLSN